MRTALTASYTLQETKSYFIPRAIYEKSPLGEGLWNYVEYVELISYLEMPLVWLSDSESCLITLIIVIAFTQGHRPKEQRIWETRISY